MVVVVDVVEKTLRPIDAVEAVVVEVVVPECLEEEEEAPVNQMDRVVEEVHLVEMDLLDKVVLVEEVEKMIVKPSVVVEEEVVLLVLKTEKVEKVVRANPN